MINDKPMIGNQGNGDVLQNNAVPLPNAGSSVLQNVAVSGLDSSDGIHLQQQISPWLQRQHSSVSQNNISTSSGGSLLAGIPLSDLKKEQKRGWSDNGRGNRPKNKRQRKNDRENRKRRKGNRGNRDFGRDLVFEKNDRQRGSRKDKRGNKKKSKADWAKALGSYPVVSSGKYNFGSPFSIDFLMFKSLRYNGKH